VRLLSARGTERTAAAWKARRTVTLRLAVLSVHTCPLAPLGGWETGGLNVYVREVSRELARRGVQVDIFTRRQIDHTADVVDLAPGARIIHLDAGPPRTFDKYEVIDHLSEFACGVQRFRLLTGRRYDLLHAHYWLSMPPALHFQDRWRVPLVAQFHTLAQLKNRVARDDLEREFEARLDLEKTAIAEADRVLALSPHDRRQMIEHYGACARKVEVVPGGVDLQRFKPGSRAAARRHLKLPEDAAVLLFVGRIQRLKGVEVLLRAAAELVEARPAGRPLRVLVVGGQPDGGPLQKPERQEIERLRALATRLGLQQAVTFVGAVEQGRLPLYYRAADVTVMPSSYESFGLVAAESMACGTPVVASQVGGLRSLIADGETGFLIRWLHPHLFAERLELLIRDPALAASLGRAAAQATRGLSWAATADRLLALYEQLLASDRPMLQAVPLGRTSLS
jgi:D-inositol-3-phosphate glycosyltransferase